MRWFTRKRKPAQVSYLHAGTEVVGNLANRLRLEQTYTHEESLAISEFLSEFVAWGKQQAPPLFATNAEGEVFCLPGVPASDLQGYVTSTALQKLYRSEAYQRRSPQEKLATAVRAWVSFMDSGVLLDMVSMLGELGWDDEVDRVSQVLNRFPPHHSNDRFLNVCECLLIAGKDTPELDA